MAKKKNKGNSGFRNGNLFCFNCGVSYKINYPQPVSMVSAIMTQFAKDHENCSPTWKEPVNSDADKKTELENAVWWIEWGEHGSSSKVMFNHLVRGVKISADSVRHHHPCDADDFKRCYKLLQTIPQIKERLADLKPLSKQWEKLVDNWDKLTEMFEQNVKEDWKNDKQIGMYEFMKSLGL